MIRRRPVSMVAFLIATLLLTGCNKRIPVTSDPPGADIYLNGKPSGLKTPAEIDLTRRFVLQTIALKLPGYREESADVEIPGNSFFGACGTPCGLCAWCITGDGNGPPPDSMQAKTANFFVYLYYLSRGSILADRIHLTLRPDATKKEPASTP